jgi:hypothetical protein
MVSDELKQELLEQYYDINVQYDWWDCVYDDFKTDMAEKGVYVDNIYFSGFWSQGDGACFEGSVYVADFAKFMDAHDLSSRYPASKFFADHSELRLDIAKVNRHYCHENTVDVSIYDITGNPYDEGTTRWDIYDTMQTLFETEVELLTLDCEEIVKNYMQNLYSKLNKEYEYLTSEEVVWETIVANELHLQVA